LGILSLLHRKDETPDRRAWKKYFEARVAVLAEWYGVPREEVLTMVAEKMALGFSGDAVFDIIKEELEARRTRIVERT
jgi:hypothetical protein